MNKLNLKKYTITVIGFFPGKGAGQAERFYFIATPTEERNQGPE